MTGWLHLVAAEPAGDYNLQISDTRDSQAKCLFVEVPKDDEAFVKSATVRKHERTVREFVHNEATHGDKRREPEERQGSS